MNSKLTTLETKSESKAAHEKIMKLQAFYSDHYRAKSVFIDDVFQNMFVYQPTFNTFKKEQKKSM